MTGKIMPQQPYLNGHLHSSPVCPPSRAHLPQTQLKRHKPAVSHNKPPLENFTNEQVNYSHFVPVSALDVIYAPIFTFSHFNAVQTRCYDEIIKTDTNVVVAAPTGCGKTVILELAIIKMLEGKRNQMPSTTARNMKAIYLAPTRALCSEKTRDWQAKFNSINLSVKEITGDLPFDAQSNIMDFLHADIVVTTPEKWDSLTRRWNDNPTLFNQIKLVLIDEVHLLNELRGSTLEVLVSRMRVLGDSIRYIAVSATAPNAGDIGEWLDSTKKAKVFEFDESYRPVQVERHVYSYKRNVSNDFAFDSMLNFKLYDILAKHMEGKPALIFCPTRKSALKAAETIANNLKVIINRRGNVPWQRPNINTSFRNTSLSRIVDYGVAIHHAGMDLDDRKSVEMLFLQGVIRVVVSTTTLAQGVNLPCHTIVIKGTRFYSCGGWKELSELDVLQMIGRAGRPQHDTSGKAIIMTEKSNYDHYKSLVSGETALESSLHLNLCEHLNAEINLGTIKSNNGAIEWLRKTFLYIRIQKNPAHYVSALNEKTASVDTSWERRLEEIVETALFELGERGLIKLEANGQLKSTGLGNIMSKAFISFKTFEKLLDMPMRANIQTLVKLHPLTYVFLIIFQLEILCSAEEMKDVTLRAGEKKPLNKVRELQEIRYPPPKMIQAVDKISVLLQAALAGVDLNEFRSDEFQPFNDNVLIYKQSFRVAKAMIDIGIQRRDSLIIRNSGVLFRSIASKAWEDRSTTLRQIDEVGQKSIKIFTCKGINSIEKLSQQDPGYIELLLNRNPPFGTTIVSKAKAFPKFFISVDEQYLLLHHGAKPVQAILKLSVGVMNTGRNIKLKTRTNNLLHASIVIWNSEDELVDFRRIQVKALIEKPREFEIKPSFGNSKSKISIQVSCDECAGLHEVYEYQPKVSQEEFPSVAHIEANDESSEEDLIDLTDADFIDEMLQMQVVKVSTLKEIKEVEVAKNVDLPNQIGPESKRRTYANKRTYEHATNNTVEENTQRYKRRAMSSSDEEDQLA
ncbi:hypothetical protein E3Q23_02738 [Wallemia mellicola]|uniref:DNA 3'-5' helicase n=1 Tax=Wallemia mellicola TaxID=1708541 RepID=A0A4T0LWC6_9BASI|nr:hypothetical protein E3Q23_02738 [Wallemia mellicola]TIC53521.1 P-loop containing nucleoside triphosphate hydrolase protein [Wallemia mellicola]TIC64166.1 P-loop containing nucleoside triphosphate hydrolase protein [Wallemia mellicola]